MDTREQTHEHELARGWAIGMAIAAGLVRLIPHPLNFTPVGALALFGGARLRSVFAWVLPLSIMAVSDLLLFVLQDHQDRTLLTFAFNPWVYASFVLAVLWGRLLLRNGSAARVAAVSVLVSVQFFLLTNLGVWMADVRNSPPLPEGTVVAWKEIPGLPAPVPDHYAHTLTGLLTCYAVALPFAGSNAPPLGFSGNQLLGDLFYSAVLFGAYAWLRRGAPLPRRAHELDAARMP
jgi:hypothetical protein